MYKQYRPEIQSSINASIEAYIVKSRVCWSSSDVKINWRYNWVLFTLIKKQIATIRLGTDEIIERKKPAVDIRLYITKNLIPNFMSKKKQKLLGSSYYAIFATGPSQMLKTFIFAFSRHLRVEFWFMVKK